MTRQMRLFVPETRHYELLKHCETIARDPANVIVSLASVKKRPAKHGGATPQYQRLQLEPGLAQKFREIVAVAIDDALAQLEDGALVADYSSGAELDGDALSHITIANGENIASQTAPLCSAKDIEVFRENKEFVRGLRYYVISLQPEEAPDTPFLHAFRFFGEGFELNRRRWAAIRTGRRLGYYDEVREPGFLFDNEIDCFCYENDMFIVNRDKFRHIFRFYEDVQVDAHRVIYGMQERIPVANLGEFVAACNRDSRMAMKLADLEEQPHAKSLTMTHVKRNIKRRNLSIEVVDQGGREMLVYSAASKWDFLHLLSDDFLDSPMTGLNYKVREKVAMKPAPHKRQQEANPLSLNGRERPNGKRAHATLPDTVMVTIPADVNS